MNVGPGIRESNAFRKLQRATFLTKADYPRTSRMVVPSGDSLRSIVAHHFGEEPRASTLLERSTLHSVYRVLLPDTSVILRINRCSRLYKELSFYTDIWVYSALTKNAIPAVRVHAVDTRRNIVPWDYEITEDAGQRSFYDLTLKNLLTRAHLRRAGMYTARIHTISLPGWGPIGAEYVRSGRPKGVDRTWRSYVMKNLGRHVSILRKAKLLSDPEGKKCIGVFPRVFPQCSGRLLHGDVANHNIFPRGDDVVFIDWEDALAGDPVYDIAYWSTGTFDHPDWLNGFLKGYTTVGSLPADFDMKYRLYFLRISIAKAVIRLKEGKDTASSDSLSARRVRSALNNFS